MPRGMYWPFFPARFVDCTYYGRKFSELLHAVLPERALFLSIVVRLCVTLDTNRVAGVLVLSELYACI